MEVFEQTRIEDFKKGIDDYLKNSLEQQEKILQHWESYLPEAKKLLSDFILVFLFFSNDKL